MSELKTKPTEQEFRAAQAQIATAYCQAVLELLMMQGHGEINYLKTPITTPKGGTYLLSLLHVDGPKIDCQNLEDLKKVE